MNENVQSIKRDKERTLIWNLCKEHRAEIKIVENVGETKM